MGSGPKLPMGDGNLEPQKQLTCSVSSTGMSNVCQPVCDLNVDQWLSRQGCLLQRNDGCCDDEYASWSVKYIAL
jgi:hypothetical protein